MAEFAGTAAWIAHGLLPGQYVCISQKRPDALRIVPDNECQICATATCGHGSMHDMAKQTVVTEILVDDLDGSPGDRTINFTWDGTAYEIELSKKNAGAFERAIKPYLDAGRRIRGTRSRRGAASRSGKRDLTAIREWAAKNGFDVSARGRIAATVIDAYEAANN